MTESQLLTHAKCRALFESAWRAARSAGVKELEVTLGVTSSALTRFANCSIHQNVADQSKVVSVRTAIDHRTARASTNRFDEDSIRAAVEEAIANTRAQAPDPELLPMAEPAGITGVERSSAGADDSTPHKRAQAVADAVAIVRDRNQNAAGICAASRSVEAILNSRGLFAYHHETQSKFSITAMAGDSSGWAKATARTGADIDSLALARRASEKASRSASPRELPPGRYTVILEPPAVQDLVGQMFFDFSATAIADQRSFLTGRMGNRLFSVAINIRDDVYHPLQSGAPFDGEGIPRRRLALVENGVAREVPYSRQAAHKCGAAATGHGFALPNEYGEAPVNIVVEGGSEPLDRIIATTGRGILVTRLWYIREVDPYEKIMTGMTRDGTFLVEDGRIVCGLKNFRFNQGLIEMLNHVDAMSPAERASGEEAFDMIVPAMRIGDFQFTEVTHF